MIPAKQPLDVGVLVMSCDRYSDLWDPYFKAFFDHWPDCPFPVYLATNEISCSHPRVRTLKAGPDADWSSSLRAVLQLFPHSRALTLFEDLFVLKPVPTAEVVDLCRWAVANRARYLRMKNSPPPDEATVRDDVGRLKENALYRTALHTALVERDFLSSMLIPGESAWSYEILSPQRVRSEPALYGTTVDVFRTHNGVEKGLWYPDVLADLQQRGYVTGPVQRGAWSVDAVRRRARWAHVRSIVRGCLPRALRPLAHRTLWSWYRLLGKVR